MVTLIFNFPSVALNSLKIIDSYMVEINFSDKWYDKVDFYYQWIFQPLQFSTSIFMLVYLYSDPYVYKISKIHFFPLKKKNLLKKRMSFREREMDALRKKEGGGNMLAAYF